MGFLVGILRLAACSLSIGDVRSPGKGDDVSDPMIFKDLDIGTS